MFVIGSEFDGSFGMLMIYKMQIPMSFDMHIIIFFSFLTSPLRNIFEITSIGIMEMWWKKNQQNELKFYTVFHS